MLFRKRLFTLLALLVLAAVVLLVYNYLTVSVEPDESVASDELSQGAYEVGASIGRGLGITLTLCIGLPLFGLFALLGWRNSVGIKTERRHQEQLEVLKQQASSNPPPENPRTLL